MKRIVTIGREYGSGGRLVAQKVADELMIPYYDKQIIQLVARETGLSETYIQEQEQKQTSSLLYNLYINSKSLPVPDQVFVAQSEVIKRLAEKEPCIFIGRCADYILQDRTDVLRVFIHAPLEERVKRACEKYGDEPELAHMLLAKHDRERASYYSHFCSRDWGNMHNYDLCINSSVGIDTVVHVIVDLVKGKRETLRDEFADLRTEE